jgi:hypothetical protein
MRRLVLATFSMCVLAACGGGGGESDWLSFSPNPVQVHMYDGEAARISITGTAGWVPSEYVEIGVDVDGALVDPDSISISSDGDMSRTLYVRLLPLAPGSYDGTIEVRACLDAQTVCAEPYGGSPWHIPMHVTVAADPGNPTTPANGDFTSGTAGWVSNVFGGASAGISVADGVLHANITSGGSTNEFAVYLHETEGINLVSGRRYRFSFDARADSARTIGAHIGEGEDRDGDHSTAIYIQPPPTVSLTTGMQTFSYEFTMWETNRAAQINFLLGGSNADVFIDNVTVTDVTPD